MCGLVFDSLEAQQAHYKSPLHRTNLQRQMKGLACKAEAAVLKEEEVVDDGEDSDSDASDSEGGDGDDKVEKRIPRR